MKEILLCILAITIMLESQLGVASSQSSFTSSILVARNNAEPYIAVDPKDSNRLFIAAFNDYYGICSIFSSEDGGKTWKSQEIGMTKRLGQYCADAVVYPDGKGNVYYVLLQYNYIGSGGEADYWNYMRGGSITISKSADGGKTWSTATALAEAPDYSTWHYDRPYIVVDNTGGQYDGNLYVAWDSFASGEILFTASTDHAQHFSQPKVVET